MGVQTAKEWRMVLRRRARDLRHYSFWSKQKVRPPFPVRSTAPAKAISDRAVNELMTLMRASRWDELARAAKKMADQYPNHLLGWKILGSAHFQRQAFAESVVALRRFLQLAPDHAEAHNELGCALRALGQYGAAEDSFLSAIQWQPGFAMAHGNYGRMLCEVGRHVEAEAQLRQSLALNPQAAASHNALAILLRNTDRPQQALTSADTAVAVEPNYFEAWLNRANVQVELTLFNDAAASFQQAIRIRPDSSQAHFGLGVLRAKVFNQSAPAMELLQRAIALDPTSADAHVAMGNLYLQTGQRALAWKAFAKAQLLSPLIRRPAKKIPADFSVLLLDAPGAGSTPLDYLLSNAPYDCYFYCVMPHGVADTPLLRSRADVVVNMLADADNGHDFLPVASDLVQGLARPTINHPDKVMQTNRAAVARLLANIQGCRFPMTQQIGQAELLQAARDGGVAGFELPVIVRLPGIHGGDAMERVEHWAAVAHFVEENPAGSYYLIEYIDYRSADDLYRKYRFINVDGVLFPYHLAIHSNWLVHHFRTDMEQHAWMRQEEEAFLSNPGQVFSAQSMQALYQVAAATQLDFSGIDCALDRQGGLLVFETNASMLVHDEKTAVYRHKNQYIAPIKQAFHAMLARLAMAV